MESNIHNSDAGMEIALTEVLKQSDEVEEKRNTVQIPRRERKSLIFVIFVMYAMVSLHGILLRLNFGEKINEFIVWKLLIIAGMMVISAAATNILCFFENEKYTLEGFLTFSFVILEFLWLDAHFFENNLTHYILSTKWKWGYEMINLFGNGLVLQKLSQSMVERNTIKKELCGMFSFSIWNAFQIYLASHLNIAYHESLVITNFLIFGVILFTLKTEEKNMRKRVMMFSIYGFALVFSLLIRKPEGITIESYLFGEEGFWGYAETVRRLLSSLKFLGPAYEGYSKDVVILLHKDLSPLRSILVYYGIIPGVLFMLVYSVALSKLWKLLISVKKRLFLFALGMSGYSHLFMRYVTGILYELGVSPMKIALPFIGDNCIIDYCCVSVILAVWYRAKKAPGNRENFGRRILCGMLELLALDEAEVTIYEEEQPKNE